MPEPIGHFLGRIPPRQPTCGFHGLALFVSWIVEADFVPIAGPLITYSVEISVDRHLERLELPLSLASWLELSTLNNPPEHKQLRTRVSHPTPRAKSAFETPSPHAHDMCNARGLLRQED